MRPLPSLVIVVLCLAGPATGLGHAGLTGVGRDPDGGTRLVFSAPVERAFLSVQEVGPAGGRRLGARRDPQDDQAVLVAGDGGATELAWRILSRDGHVVSGRALTAGGTAGGSRRDPAAQIAADAIVIGGLLGLIGLVSLRFGVVGPAWRSGGPRPPGAPGDDARRVAGEALERAAGRWWAVLGAFGGVTVIGLVAGPVALLAALDAGPGDLRTLLGETRWGRAWTLQAVGIVLATATAVALRRHAARDAPDPPGSWGYAIGLPAGAAGVAISWAGHAGSGTDQFLGIALDALHVLASAVWLGGLAGLLALLLPARRMLDATSGTRLAAGVVVRFSAVAMTCVGVIVLTGVYRTLAELRGLGDLTGTGYGQVLLVKLGVFALLLAGGAYNRLVLHPRLERAALGLDADDRGAADRLRVSVTAEIGLATALLVAVAVLPGLPPP